MNWFKTTPKTDDELQAELHALCDKLIASQMTSHSEMERYEELLKEIYLRKLKPCIILKPSN